jgi:30S ribosomal protein 3
LTPKFQLNILWLENKLGIAINQIQLDEQIPLTNYIFWPKSDAWDQIQRELETKPWIPNEAKVNLLNSTAAVLNEWQSFVNKSVNSNVLK